MATRSLWFAMGSHTAWNFLQGDMLGVAVSGFGAATDSLFQLLGYMEHIRGQDSGNPFSDRAGVARSVGRYTGIQNNIPQPVVRWISIQPWVPEQ